MKLILILTALAVLFVIVPPAFSDVTIAAPANNSTVYPPFTLEATASPCSGQRVTAMGYSFDHEKTKIIHSTSIKVKGLKPKVGYHLLKVHSWGSRGAKCTTSIQISAEINSNDTSIGSPYTIWPDIQGIQPSSWISVKDSGTPGTATGNLTLVSSPTEGAPAMEFTTTSSNYGGWRYSVDFGQDSTDNQFTLSADVYIQSGTIGNLELDLNQVLDDRSVIIYGFQCDGDYGDWDFAYNSDPNDPSNPSGRAAWMHTSSPCNPMQWGPGQHQIVIPYSRDNEGNVDYQGVSFDGTLTIWNFAPINSQFNLSWAPGVLNANVQVDGPHASATSVVDITNLQVVSSYFPYN